MGSDTAKRMLREIDFEEAPEVERLFEELIEAVEDLEEDRDKLERRLVDLVQVVDKLDDRVQGIEAELDEDDES